MRRFTLVELMIVVAIVAILAAVAIPIAQNFKYKAAASELPVTIMGIGNAAVIYGQENVTTTISYNVLSPDNHPGKSLRAFPTSGTPYETIGFLPDGMVRGSYLFGVNGTCQGANCINSDVQVTGFMNVDGDNVEWSVTKDFYWLFTGAPPIPTMNAWFTLFDGCSSISPKLPVAGKCF